MANYATAKTAFGALLQNHRRAAGISQDELAERAGLSRISDLERGEHRCAHPETIRRLAAALELTDAEKASLSRAARPAPPTMRMPGTEHAIPLPLPLTTFVGRQRELVELAMLLNETRLLTLVGSGGIGKTRLALQLARAHAAGVDDTPFVELAAVSEPMLLSRLTARALGVAERAGEPVETTLRDYLHERRILLVLDNCEHLLGACALFVEPLLRTCPNLRVLATSREPLEVPGELAWRVPPLETPDADAVLSPTALLAFEGIELFIERARAAQTNFALTPRNARPIAEVCRRLDGVPLAIELAAARTTILSPEQLASRLDDRFQLLTGGSRTAPPRHQTLRAAVEWSHDLLNDVERVLFRRLGVFAGGCSIEEIEQVCVGDGLELAAVLEGLARLVRASLVVSEVRDSGARYSLQETMRAFAVERMGVAGETEFMRERHLLFYLALAEEAESRLTGRDQVAWLNRLETDRDNLWAALEWSTQHGNPEAALRLAGALQFFWHLRGSFSEGARWLRRALESVAKARPHLCA